METPAPSSYAAATEPPGASSMTTPTDYNLSPASDSDNGRTAGSSAPQPCSHCQSRDSAPEQFVYALGQLEIRMPTIGIEREFQQRERQLYAGSRRKDRRDER